MVSTTLYAKNLYFLTSKRDYEPHLEEAVQPREIVNVADEPIVIGYSLADLIEEARLEILLGEYNYRMPAVGSELESANRDLLLRMRPIAGASFAEGFNAELARAIVTLSYAMDS